MTAFDETLYGRDDEMDDYGDGSYGDAATTRNTKRKRKKKKNPKPQWL